MAIVNEHYAECSFSTRQFQRTRNSIYFLRCTQFSTTQVPLFMQSVEKPRSLLVVSRVECVTARHYFIRSCVKQRRWKFLWPVYKIIFFRILYDWHWVSVALKNCTRRDQLKIAGQSDQFGQWRFTENNSVDNGFKFLQFSHFFSFSSKRFLIETSQFKYFVKQNFILLFQQVLLTKLVDECLRLNVNVFVVVAFDILTAYFEVYLTRYVRLLLHLCYILRAMLEI